MQQPDLPIIHKTSALYQALNGLQQIVPKASRYTLWVRCENTTLEILEGLIRVSHLSQDKRLEPLIQVSVLVDTLRVLIRLSFEVKAISEKKYLFFQQMLEEIGKMLGGWIKSLKQK